MTETFKKIDNQTIEKTITIITNYSKVRLEAKKKELEDYKKSVDLELIKVNNMLKEFD